MQRQTKNGIWVYVSLTSRGTDIDNRILGHDMRFQTMRYVRPAKPQTSLRICAV